MTFITRQLQITFDIGTEQFSTGTNTLVLTGMRTIVSVMNTNGFSLGTMSAKIYGMRLEDMAKLCNLGKLFMASNNYQVTVEAGDSVNGLTKIFTGTIFQGSISYDMPDVSLDIMSMAGFYQKQQAAPVFSQSGAVDIVSALNAVKPPEFTIQSNLKVPVMVSNPYYSGSPIDQIKRICADAGINYDIRNNTVYLWSVGGAVDDSSVDINAGNGLIGYPVFESTNLIVKTSFNPNLVNGKTCNVSSDAIGATGSWTATVVSHYLSSEAPGGPWTTEARMIPPNLFYPNGQ